MKQLLTLLAVLYISAGQAQLTPILPTNENVPTFTSDQILTFGAGAFAGGFAGAFVKDKTNSKFLGLLTGAIVGAGIGYAKDRWDMQNNSAIPNPSAPYNDTLAASLGGALGGFTITINFGGRKNSKAGYNGRYFKKRKH